MKQGSTKTLITGILTILSAVVSAGITYLKTGVLPDFGVLISAITAGVGLIVARDNTTTSKDAGAE